MRRLAAILFFALLLAVVPALSVLPRAEAHGPSSGDNAAAFRSAMRVLWEDHITWTRLYLVSAIAGLPDTQATAERLLRNQADIGNAVKSFYGEAGGTKLTVLLR